MHNKKTIQLYPIVAMQFDKLSMKMKLEENSAKTNYTSSKSPR